jgi:hypothetical protein
MQETFSLSIKNLLLHVHTRKIPNLLDTYNMHIEYIKETNFYGLTMRRSASQRYPTHRG